MHEYHYNYLLLFFLVFCFWLTWCVIYLASMEENEERTLWDVTEENDKLQPVGDTNMATLMEDVNFESKSQNGCKA